MEVNGTHFKILKLFEMRKGVVLFNLFVIDIFSGFGVTLSFLILITLKCLFLLLVTELLSSCPGLKKKGAQFIHQI